MISIGNNNTMTTTDLRGRSFDIPSLARLKKKRGDFARPFLRRSLEAAATLLLLIQSLALRKKAPF